MGTTKADIREWLERYKDSGATHLIVVCDTFDHEDYPVPVMPNESVDEVERSHNTNMQRVMEIYNYALDLEEQIAKGRVFSREPKHHTKNETDVKKLAKENKKLKKRIEELNKFDRTDILDLEQ